MTSRVSSPRAQVGAYYFDGWAGRHKDADKAEWAKNAPTHLTQRMLKEFPDREPVWGWRDASLPIMERQIDLAADHGLAFFAFCWYWHDDEKAIREDPKHTGLELFLKAANNGRMSFCLLVANHAGFEIKGEAAWRKAADLWMPYLTHPRHVRVGGKPLLIIFNPGGGDKTGFDHLQQADVPVLPRPHAPGVWCPREGRHRLDGQAPGRDPRRTDRRRLRLERARRGQLHRADQGRPGGQIPEGSARGRPAVNAATPRLPRTVPVRIMAGHARPRLHP